MIEGKVCLPPPDLPSTDKFSVLFNILHSQQAGKNIIIQGNRCLNLATHNYLGLVENQKIEECTIECMNKYGVGSCGPRGFYGTVGKQPGIGLLFIF